MAGAVGPGQMADLYRRAWGNFPTGLSVVTTRRPDGGVYGMTAVRVMFGSQAPPTVVLLLGRQRQTYDNLEREGRFGLSILGGDQVGWAEYCARPPEARGPNPPGAYRYSATGAAMVDGCLAFMDCRVAARYELSPQAMLFVGEVEGVEMGQGFPLMFHRGEYLSVG